MRPLLLATAAVSALAVAAAPPLSLCIALVPVAARHASHATDAAHATDHATDAAHATDHATDADSAQLQTGGLPYTTRKTGNVYNRWDAARAGGTCEEHQSRWEELVKQEYEVVRAKTSGAKDVNWPSRA